MTKSAAEMNRHAPAPEIWTSPSEDATGSVPLGNGEMAANVWFTPDGVLHILLARTDAWDEAHRLCKLGLVELSFDPDGTEELKQGFEHSLSLRDASLTIRLGDPSQPFRTTRVWIDRHRDVLWLESESTRPSGVSARVVRLRTAPEETSASGMGKLSGDGSVTIRVGADSGLGPDELGHTAIAVAHPNEDSVYPGNLEMQKLDGFDPLYREDPLLHRVFGAALVGDPGFSVASGTAPLSDGAEEVGVLRSNEPSRSHRLAIVSGAHEHSSRDEWARQIEPLLSYAESALRKPETHAGARAEHERAWRSFWSRSWIVASGDEAAEAVTRAGELQRYVTALAGRGKYPIKFNGSLFTTGDYIDPMKGPPAVDHDYRRWGGCYWFQNTRLVYRPTLYSGDFDLARSWIDFMYNALPIAKYRVENLSGAQGAYFPETMTIWGTFRNLDYGFDRRGDRSEAISQSDFLGYYFQGGLEFSLFLIEYLRMTGDEGVWLERGWPVVQEVITFYFSFYKTRDEAGKLRIAPSQSLETWQRATNPAPEIAGLRRVIDELTGLPPELTPGVSREDLQMLSDQVPPLPVSSGEDRAQRLLPAREYSKLGNVENPELYAVFPYEIAARGTAIEHAAQQAFDERINREIGGWHQTPIQAALLGRTEEARDMLIALVRPDLAPAAGRDLLLESVDRDRIQDWAVGLFRTPERTPRFRGFYNPSFDWIPDQDQGGVIWATLQRMAMHTHNGLELLPAWPSDWDIDMKLYAPGPCVVELKTRGGTLEHCSVTPLGGPYAARTDQPSPAVEAVTPSFDPEHIVPQMFKW